MYEDIIRSIVRLVVESFIIDNKQKKDIWLYIKRFMWFGDGKYVLWSLR